MSLVPGEPDLAEIVKAEREWVSQTLQEHGAILFRGFGICCAEDFSRVIMALGWDEFRYTGVAGADRIKLAERVYTASGIPLDTMITFHHEMAMMRNFPRRVLFFGQQPAAAGGQTSFIPSNILVEKLQEEMPEVVEKFEQDGIIYTLHTKSKYIGTSTIDTECTVWQRMLKTTNLVEAEKRALEMLNCDKVKFNNDGSADFTYQMKPIRKYNNKRVMWPRLKSYEIGDRETIVTYGDGSPIPSEAIETIEKIYEENCVDINWQKGDIVLVDNLTVQHARRPGKPPRVVLVSISN
ncbi:clavaminate synthase-like protein [Iris pallida]|uniref:Clavaminate synthase-like protein n=2 Tax=Iris pallida TaxID=29817 RepID=A0AAX6I6F1_IRIPA|nr:clavaminate synthase-like protein [Iris pallida]